MVSFRSGLNADGSGYSHHAIPRSGGGYSAGYQTGARSNAARQVSAPKALSRHQNLRCLHLQDLVSSQPEPAATRNTNAERTVWGFGDGRSINVVETAVGRVSVLVCWENFMPLARAASTCKTWKSIAPRQPIIGRTGWLPCSISTVKILPLL